MDGYTDIDAGARLRLAFELDEVTLVASIQDALTGKVAEAAGFPAAVLGGATVTNGLLGLPDSGFLTLFEMEFVLSRAASACEIPILIDTDAGYGTAINVVRTVQTLERAGAAGVFIEDQAEPVRCGIVEGHVLVSPEEMVGKIKAAVASRRSDSFVVIARTDAWAIEGMDGVIQRGRQYVDAGADGFFVDGLPSIDDNKTIVNEVPASFHIAILGRSSSVPQLQAMGFSAAVSGPAPLRSAAVTAFMRYKDVIKGVDPEVVFAQESAGTPLDGWYRFSGFDEIRELEERYMPSDYLALRYNRTHAGFYDLGS